MEKKNVAASVIGLYAAYFICYLVKLSPSAIMPQLQLELNLTSSQVGFISSMYFLSYALSQFFIGGLCRRFTAHVVCGVGLFISVLGLALFGYGNSVAALATGRFILGLGTAPFFIGLVYYLQNCFEGKAYAKVYGYSIFVGNIASALAAYPLQAFLKVSDRRMLCILIAFISIAVGITLVFLSGRSGVARVSGKQGSVLKQLWIDIRFVFSNRLLIAGLLVWLIQCACLMSYQGLWCVKWTSVAFAGRSSVSGLSGVFVSAGVVLSGLLSERLKHMEPLVNRNSSRGTILHSAGILSLISVVLVIVTKILPDTIWAFSLAMMADVLYGYAGGNIIAQTGVYVRETIGAERNANVMGVFNGFGCLMQQLTQWLTGVGIDIFVVRSTMAMSFSYTYAVVGLLILIDLLITAKRLRK